ncbi:hypothetical protein JYK02_20755 [Corallococcus macrosporus]|uniref:Uncharacterized protein n=1 Tax=Corallococcus macrosporus TaxID=35 RepID=A0ABS3DFA2_9BACT|nr:hypothetical protein [Corallococcus macrosporus]MBN8229947.1 hypothetical protein [Corallococcus macrosporus]
MPLDLEAFQKTQHYQVRATVAEVLEDLRSMEAPPPKPPLNAFQMGARVGTGLIIAGVLGLGVFGFVLDGSHAGLILLCIGMILGGFVTLVVSKVFGMDLELKAGGPRWVEPQMAQRRRLVATLLERFQVDLDAKAPVDVKLDLTSAVEGHKRVHLENQGPRTRQDFVDPWLSLQGRFADGTHLHLTVVDQVRTLQRSKVSASGKLKTKARRDGVSLLQVALRVKPERHPGLLAQEARARDAVRLPPGARLKRVRVAEDRVELRVLLDEDWVAHARKAEAEKPDASRTATMMLLSLYQVLGAARQQGPAQGRQQAV